MAAHRYAVVEETGYVVNVILIDDPFPKNYTIAHPVPTKLIDLTEPKDTDVPFIINLKVNAPVSPGDTIDLKTGDVTKPIIPTAEPTQQDVVDERTRRFEMGFDFEFQGRGVHHIGTTKSDMEGWDEVTKVADAARAIGMGDMPIVIETNTGSVTTTANEWPYVILAAAQMRQPLWLKSFALQAMSPIPADFRDDKYWT